MMFDADLSPLEAELAWLRSFEERLPLLTSRESLDPREFGGDSYEE